MKLQNLHEKFVLPRATGMVCMQHRAATEDLMPKTNVQKGDRVTVYLGRIAQERREQVISFIRRHGAGPFKVRGVGPTEVALALPGECKCRNIPHSCVMRCD